jgi:hypothetical protein
MHFAFSNGIDRSIIPSSIGSCVFLVQNSWYVCGTCIRHAEVPVRPGVFGAIYVLLRLVHGIRAIQVAVD